MMSLFDGNEEEELQWHPILRQPRRPMNFSREVTFRSPAIESARKKVAQIGAKL